MTTAVTPNSRKIWKIRPLKEKYGNKYGKKNIFLSFLTFFVVFCLFLRSWRPGGLAKASWRWCASVPPNMSPWRATRLQNVLFYVFRPPFRPTGSSIPTLFVEQIFFDEGSDPPRPIPQDPHQNVAQNDVLASSPSFFLDPFVTKTLFLFQTILS